MQVIKLNDKSPKCPKCGAVWTHECFTTCEQGFKPKCDYCGYVFGDK